MEEQTETLYSTAEIMLATGMQRGTITNRAAKLGFDRNGFGYTAEQVLKILTAPLESHRKSMQAAMELREKLNGMIEDEKLPIRITEGKAGKVTVQHIGTKIGTGV